MSNVLELGLVSIVIAWVIQFLSTTPKKHEFNPLFLIFYSLGAIILAWDGYQSGKVVLAILYFASFVVPVALLMKTTR